MLKEAGASHVVLGHSERRQFFGETDDGVGKKARAAFDHGLMAESDIDGALVGGACLKPESFLRIVQFSLA